MPTRNSSTDGMTALGHAARRQLALKVLAQHAGPAAGTEALAAAAHRAYDDLVRVSAPLIGQVGVDALTGRALHLGEGNTRGWSARASRSKRKGHLLRS